MNGSLQTRIGGIAPSSHTAAFGIACRTVAAPLGQALARGEALSHGPLPSQALSWLASGAVGEILLASGHHREQSLLAVALSTAIQFSIETEDTPHFPTLPPVPYPRGVNPATAALQDFASRSIRFRNSPDPQTLLAAIGARTENVRRFLDSELADILRGAEYPPDAVKAVFLRGSYLWDGKKNIPGQDVDLIFITQRPFESNVACGAFGAPERFGLPPVIHIHLFSEREFLAGSDEIALTAKMMAMEGIQVTGPLYLQGIRPSDVLYLIYANSFWGLFLDVLLSTKNTSDYLHAISRLQMGKEILLELVKRAGGDAAYLEERFGILDGMISFKEGALLLNPDDVRHMRSLIFEAIIFARDLIRISRGAACLQSFGIQGAALAGHCLEMAPMIPTHPIHHPRRLHLFPAGLNEAIVLAGKEDEQSIFSWDVHMKTGGPIGTVKIQTLRPGRQKGIVFALKDVHLQQSMADALAYWLFRLSQDLGYPVRTALREQTPAGFARSMAAYFDFVELGLCRRSFIEMTHPQSREETISILEGFMGSGAAAGVVITARASRHIGSNPQLRIESSP